MNRLFEEVAYLSYYFHWPYDQIMRMEHSERQQWVAEAAKINHQINDKTHEGSTESWL